MILTQCAACAKPLAHDAPRCVRCWTAYCDASCQLEHWNNGHKKQCKKIARGGGAEMFYADAKYRESAEAAVLECEDQIPADANCYICGDAPSHGAMQGLVNGCGCHGGAGIAHVACLARMAQVAVKDYEEMGLGEGITKWQICTDCGQAYCGAVSVALGWACWKTYLGRPEANGYRIKALAVLGGNLSVEDPERALPVLAAHRAALQRYWPNEQRMMLATQGNMANAYDELDQNEEALRLYREVFAGQLTLFGPTHEETIQTGNNISLQLIDLELFDEAKQSARRQYKIVRRTLDDRHVQSILAHQRLADALLDDPASSRADLVQAVALLEHCFKMRERVFGPHDPFTISTAEQLAKAREALAEL